MAAGCPGAQRSEDVLLTRFDAAALVPVLRGRQYLLVHVERARALEDAREKQHAQASEEFSRLAHHSADTQREVIFSVECNQDHGQQRKPCTMPRSLLSFARLRLKLM